jgi:hypothetical protein
MLFVNMTFFNENGYYCQNTETNFFWVVQQSIYLSGGCHHPETRTGDGQLNQLEQLQKKHMEITPKLSLNNKILLNVFPVIWIYIALNYRFACPVSCNKS